MGRLGARPLEGIRAREGRGRADLRSRAWRHRRAARRQRRRQDDHHRHAARPAAADLRDGACARRRHDPRPLPGAGAHELLLPLCRASRPADGGGEPAGLCAPLRRGAGGPACAGAGRGAGAHPAAETTHPHALRRPEIPPRARQGAGERAAAPAARRADRLPRPRDRRLGALLSGRLCAADRRHHPARLPQHAGGGAALP